MLDKLKLLIEYIKVFPSRLKSMKRPDKDDIKYAVLVTFLVIIAVGTYNNARADDSPWFSEPGYVMIGMDWEYKPNLCYKDQGREVGHLGFGIPIYSTPNWSVNAQYTHLSCAFSPDRGYIDNAGIIFVLRP